jgi:phosphoribosyl 1,2-cyclic phosphodiesterase
MRLCVLGSGSKGNCTYIESGDTRILIDCGFSGVEIQRRLQSIGVVIETLSSILVTHEHGDHVRGVAILSRKYNLPIFANEATCAAAGKDLGNLHSFRKFETGTSFVFQNLQIHPFRISHDAADPVGFVVEDDFFKVGYCTDTGIATKLMQHRLADCSGLVLESNHDPVLLKNGPYSPALQQRVRSKTGHLANVEAADFLSGLLHERLEHVVLAHISETNNKPEIALQTVTKILKENGNGQDFAAQISLSWQDRAGRLIDLEKGSIACGSM